MEQYSKIPFTLFKYLTKDLLKYFLFALISFIILIFFVDIIELFRRSSHKVGVKHLIKANFVDIIGMASLKIPGNIEKVIPYPIHPCLPKVCCCYAFVMGNYI